MIDFESPLYLLCVAFLLAFSCPEAEAKSVTLSGLYRAELIRVIDGDTVEARIRIWIGQTVTTRIRLRDIDAPEMKSRCPAEHKAALRAKKTLSRLLEHSTLLLSEISGGTYHGRVLAHLHLPDGRSISDILLKRGLVKPYRPRSSWCRSSSETD